MKMQIVCLVIVFSIFSQAKTLFVSDIDDTIKISHVLDKLEMVKNAIRVHNHFYGMAQVYTAYAEADPTVQFAYLSAAPEKMMLDFHFEFLSINQFPKGRLILRENLNDHVFKLTAIRELIQLHKPDKIILVGDNGERDPFVYSQIQAENPGIPVFIYIHQVYSHLNSEDTGVPPQVNQQIFVTGIDLAKLFMQQGFVSTSIFENYVNKVGPYMLAQSFSKKNGSTTFPAWIDCRDVLNVSKLSRNRWKLKIPRAQLVRLNTNELLGVYDEKLKARCQNGPYED
jgi:phosphatidate phosphatase APP1